MLIRDYISRSKKTAYKGHLASKENISTKKSESNMKSDKVFMGNFTVCVTHRTLLGWQLKLDDANMVCSIHGKV